MLLARPRGLFAGVPMLLARPRGILQEFICFLHDLGAFCRSSIAFCTTSVLFVRLQLSNLSLEETNASLEETNFWLQKPLPYFWTINLLPDHTKGQSILPIGLFLHPRYLVSANFVSRFPRFTVSPFPTTSVELHFTFRSYRLTQNRCGTTAGAAPGVPYNDPGIAILAVKIGVLELKRRHMHIDLGLQQTVNRLK